jgi:hypothetical protein
MDEVLDPGIVGIPSRRSSGCHPPGSRRPSSMSKGGLDLLELLQNAGRRFRDAPLPLRDHGLARPDPAGKLRLAEAGRHTAVTNPLRGVHRARILASGTGADSWAGWRVSPLAADALRRSARGPRRRARPLPRLSLAA